MSEHDFLARWSRRKQTVQSGLPLPEPDAAAATSAPEAVDNEPPKPEVDLASLPPIDAIDATTDVAAFLHKGVPLELSRAALRRAWSADPAIRDFVGLAENAWDFNDPNAMPGFGPLEWSAAQVEAVVRCIVGDVAQSLADPLSATASIEQSVPAQPVPAEPSAASPAEAAPVVQSASAAPRPILDEPAPVEASPVRRRTHGGALPR